MSTIGSVEHNNGMEGIEDELVHFDKVKACYHTAATRLNLTYTLSSALASTPQDWIGLFPLNWTDTLNPLAFTWTAPKSKSRKKKKNKSKEEQKHQVNFPLESISNPTKQQQYQFVYVSKSGRVYGASRAFTIQGEELWNLEGDDEDFSRLSSLPCSPAPRRDSEISILSRGNTGYSTESPVMLSYPSDGEADWELPNLSDAKEKDESPISEFSDIEILSTSPSKDNAGIYSSTVHLNEEDFTSEEVDASTSKPKVTSCETADEKEREEISTRSQRKRNKKNKKKESVTKRKEVKEEDEEEDEENEENDKKEIVRQTVITESLVEKLKFIDIGESSNGENEILSDGDDLRGGSCSLKKGKKKKKKDRARKLITELSPRVSLTSVKEKEDDIVKELVEETKQSVKKSKKKKKNIDLITEGAEQTLNTLVDNSESKNSTSSHISNNSLMQPLTHTDNQITENSASPMFPFKKKYKKWELSENDSANEKKVFKEIKKAKNSGNQFALMYFETKVANVNNEVEIKREWKKEITAGNSEPTEGDMIESFDEKPKKKKKNKKLKLESDVLESIAETKEENIERSKELKETVVDSNKIEEEKVLEASAQSNTSVEGFRKNKKNKNKNKTKTQAAEDETAPEEDKEIIIGCKFMKTTINNFIKMEDAENLSKEKKRKNKSKEKVEDVKEDQELTTFETPSESQEKKNKKNKQKDTVPDTGTAVVKTNNEKLEKAKAVESKKNRKEKKRTNFEILQKEIKEDNLDKQAGLKIEKDDRKADKDSLKIEKDSLETEKDRLKISCDQNLAKQPALKTKPGKKITQRKVELTAFSGTGSTMTITATVDPEIKTETEKQVAAVSPTISDVKSGKKKSKKEKKLEKLLLTSSAFENNKTVNAREKEDIFRNAGTSVIKTNDVITGKKTKKNIGESSNVLCPLLEKEGKMREYRSKYLYKAKTVKRVKMEAAIKSAARKEKRAKLAAARAQLLENVLETKILPESEEKAELELGAMITKAAAENYPENEIKTEENIQDSKTENDDEKISSSSSAALSSSPPNDVNNFPPLQKPAFVKKLFADVVDENGGKRASLKTAAGHGLKKPRQFGAISPFIIKAANTGNATKRRSKSPPSSSLTAPFKFCLLDIMDAVPEDPSAFNFVQWQKEKAFGKATDQASSSFNVLETVNKLKMATENVWNNPTESKVKVDNSSRMLERALSEDTMGVLASYANVLKRSKDGAKEETINTTKVDAVNDSKTRTKSMGISNKLKSSPNAQLHQQLEEKKKIIRARRAIFSGYKNFDSTAAIDAQCYFLDKFDKSSSSLPRPKVKTTRTLKNIKDRHKKLRQTRLQNRQFKEMKNSCILTNTCLSVQGATTSNKNKPDPNVKATCNDMRVITWPLPLCFKTGSSEHGSSRDKRAVVLFGINKEMEKAKHSGHEEGSSSLDKGVIRFGQFEWAGFNPGPSTSMDDQNTVTDRLEKSTKQQSRQVFQSALQNALKVGADKPIGSSMPWKEKRMKLYAGLPSSLGVAHRVIQKLRSEVKMKEREVNGLCNEVNSLKEVVKKQLRHEVNARCKLIAVKKKYKSIKLSQKTLKHGSVSKRSRGHKQEDTTSEMSDDNRPMREPPCKRKRLDTPASMAPGVREEGPFNSESMTITANKLQFTSTKKDIAYEEKPFNLYPNIQEELQTLQKEVDSGTKTTDSRKNLSKERQEKQPVGWHFQNPLFLVQNPPSPTSDFVNKQALGISEWEQTYFNQPPENNWSVDPNPRDRVDQGAFSSTSGLTGNFFQVPHFVNDTNRGISKNSQHQHHPNFRNDIPARAYEYDQLNFSPPKPALLPTPIPPLHQSPPEHPPPPPPPMVLMKPSGRPFYRCGSPPGKFFQQYQSSSSRIQSLPRNEWPPLVGAPKPHLSNKAFPGMHGHSESFQNYPFFTASRQYPDREEMLRIQRIHPKRFQIAENFPFHSDNYMMFYQQPRQFTANFEDNVINGPVPYSNEIPDEDRYFREFPLYNYDHLRS